MDQQIQKIETFPKPSKLGTMLKEKSKQKVKELIGYSNYHSEFDVWAYDLIKNIFFKREMILFFADNVVLDVLITDYFLGNKIREYIYWFQAYRLLKMQKMTINYNKIYGDIIAKKCPQKKEECLTLLQKETLSAIDIIELNQKIFLVWKKKMKWPISNIVPIANPIFYKYWIIRKSTNSTTANSQIISNSAETPFPNGGKSLFYNPWRFTDQEKLKTKIYNLKSKLCHHNQK